MHKPQHTRATLTAIALSLGLHALVLGLLLIPRWPSAPEPRPPITVFLTLPPAPETAPDFPPQVPDDPRLTPPEESPESRISETDPTHSPAIEPDPDFPFEWPQESPPPDAHQLRRDALQLARTEPQITRPESGTGRTMSYAPAPRLPGAPGWLNQHVGPVAPSADTWRDNAGDFRGRYVTASGQVFCTRRDMPTNEEFNQPWKYAAVTYTWNCGQERPPPPDPDDPWIARPAQPAP